MVNSTMADLNPANMAIRGSSFDLILVVYGMGHFQKLCTIFVWFPCYIVDEFTFFLGGIVSQIVIVDHANYATCI